MSENKWVSPEPSDGEITRFLADWQCGDPNALKNIFHLVYDNLKAMARSYMQNPNGTMQPTALVNEVYIRLSEKESLDFPDRKHFFGFAGQVLRAVVMDYVRNKAAQKRGGGQVVFQFDEEISGALSKGLDVDTLIALDDALGELEKLDKRQAKIVELRFFAGFQIEELCEAIGVSRATVIRELRHAKKWLARKLGAERSSESKIDL